MEMKQISETTLKVSVTMDDLEDYGMELKDFLIPQEKTEEFFYTMLDELDLPDNFRNSGMLSFRVTPRKDRIDVFVTKTELNDHMTLEDFDEDFSPEEFFQSLEKTIQQTGDEELMKQVEGLLEETKNQTDATEQGEDEFVHYVFRFDTFIDAVQFAVALDMPTAGSELYKMADTYYMTVLIEILNKPSYYANLMYARMLEHADNSRYTRAYLQEHGVLLLPYQAVEALKQVG